MREQNALKLFAVHLLSSTRLTHGLLWDGIAHPAPCGTSPFLPVSPPCAPEHHTPSSSGECGHVLAPMRTAAGQRRLKIRLAPCAPRLESRPISTTSAAPRFRRHDAALRARHRPPRHDRVAHTRPRISCRISRLPLPPQPSPSGLRPSPCLALPEASGGASAGRVRHRLELGRRARSSQRVEAEVRRLMREGVLHVLERRRGPLGVDERRV